MSKAQAVIEGAIKGSENPFFKKDGHGTKYADLASVWDACRKPLTDNELSVLQMPTESEGGIGIETMIVHSSGEFISNKFTMPVSKLDAQGVGSAITYARRYALAAMVGVAPEEDDGNAATKAAPPKVMSESVIAMHIKRIEEAADAKAAKSSYAVALAECNALGDPTAQKRIKDVLLAKWTPKDAGQ